MINKSDLFKAAWAVARKGAQDFGGRASKYFAEALKMGYAYIKARAAKVAAPVLTAADKINTLALIVLSWPRNLRNTFAFRFIMDNADRVAKYGTSTKFSDRQVEIVNDLYSKHA